MKKYLLPILFIIFASYYRANAQNIDTLLNKSEEVLEKGRVFSIKGLGTAFPLGKVNDVLNPRFSTQIGLQIMMKNPRYFIYPALDYVNFGYSQLNDDPEYNNIIKNASAKLYVGTLSAGMMHTINKFRVFSSAGLGGGFINEPRASVLGSGKEIYYENKSSFTGTVRLNFGADYGKRTFKLFGEVSYMLHTRKIEDRNLHTLAITVGTRTNLFRLARAVRTIKDKIH